MPETVRADMAYTGSLCSAYKFLPSACVAVRQLSIPVGKALNGTENEVSASGIRDNYLRGTVGEFLREKIREGADLSIVSAYFTIYAFGVLQNRLATIDRMRFLFGEPRFIQSLAPERTDEKAFKIEDEALQLANL